MNCRTIQNKILILPDPRLVPDDLWDHVSACAGCRDWATQVARLESLLERLPVPVAPGGKKEELLESLSQDDRVIKRPFAVPARKGVLDSVLAAMQNNGKLIAALAAGVLIVLGSSWWLSRPGARPEVANATTPPYPFLKKVSDRYVALAKDETSLKKLDDLGGLAGDISIEAKNLSLIASAEELGSLARMFEKVKEGMVRQAKLVPLDAMPLQERTECLKQFHSVAKKLKDVAVAMETLKGNVPPDAKEPIIKIMRSAKDGEEFLLAKAG